ncbi:cell division protein [Secundilactobacillus oryzae JCM 18671]|uniref:Cell division protein n=1 Tax=Secundilactobacillus oryzae JCM 18671 TaxID=1291743 RepID=A0A081BGM3_9LACO|nr:RNA-binding protein [Secundilactobacillus oryzae]GAK47191.1 cell division protein [Secundilactobacillus oryzae JCM 18671]
MDSNVTQHFRRDEVPFIEMVTDLINEASEEYRPVLTHFLNPRQVYILTTIANGNDDVKIQAFGGYENAELQRVLIYPQYFEPQQKDFDIAIFEINYPVKFAVLHHSQVLGTLANLGVDREVIGDIITDGSRWQFFVEGAMATYFDNQVDQIGKIKVRLDPLEITEAISPLSEWEEEGASLSSIRLDNIVATAFHLSRHRAKALVEGSKVRVNWAVSEKPDYDLAIEDIISVRGFGRIKLVSLNGQTKKDKIRVTMAVLRK